MRVLLHRDTDLGPASAQIQIRLFDLVTSKMKEVNPTPTVPVSNTQNTNMIL